MDDWNLNPEQRPEEHASVLNKPNPTDLAREQLSMGDSEQISLFENLLGSIPDAILISDADGRILLANDQATTLFNYQRDKLIGQQVEVLMPDRFRKAHVRHQQDYWIEPRMRPMGIGLNLVGQRSDCSEFPVEISLSPLQLAGQEFVVSSVRDTSERMRSQKSVRQREERFRLLIDTIPVCISYTDKQQRYQLNNKVYEEWFGLSREEITGRHVKEILGDTVYAASKSRIEAALDGKEQTFEAVLPKLEGGTRHVLVNYMPEGHTEDQVEGFFTVVIDISERIEAEKAVQESERKFRKIFEHSNDPIFLLEPAGNLIVDANARACEMLDYSREELLSIGIAAIHPDEMPELIAFAESVFNSGHGWTNQLTCTTKAGQVLPAEMSASIVNMEGKDCLIAVVRDTTERRAAEKRIRQEASRAESLARIAARLNAHLSLDGVVNAVCEETALAMEADSILLLLVDDKKLGLVPAASTGMPSEFIEQYNLIPIELYESSVDPLNPVIVLTDTRDSPDLPNSHLFEKYDVHSIAAVSLMREQQLIGMLGIYCFHDQREFNPDELALLKGLADQATQAIDNARLRIQAEQAAVAEERNRLARDLHDSITQSLYSQTLYSEAASRRLQVGDVNEVNEHLHVLRQTALQALQEMRLLIFELRPPILDERGLVAAINARLEAVEERSGQHKEVNVDGDLRLPPELEATLYRIVQEALNNVLKHADAQKVIVSLTQIDDLLTLEVIDDGSGFDVDSSQSLSSFGLQGMRERVSKVGGIMEVHSKPGEGTRLKVEVSI